ncbi:Integrase core domain-containing protein [Roseateles sp. YR242]|nr:Integrase core domain-containing protein [Roseateles sp. YR242]
MGQARRGRRWRDGGLVCHSDRGSQYVSIRYTERLAEAGIEPSVGSKGDSYDNALAETINGLYKAELIRRRAPWKTKESVDQVRGLGCPLTEGSFDPLVKDIDAFNENVDAEYHQFIAEAAKNSLRRYREFPSRLVFEGGVQGEMSSSGAKFSRLSKLCVELLCASDANLKEEFELILDME